MLGASPLSLPICGRVSFVVIPDVSSDYGKSQSLWHLVLNIAAQSEGD